MLCIGGAFNDLLDCEERIQIDVMWFASADGWLGLINGFYIHDLTADTAERVLKEKGKALNLCAELRHEYTIMIPTDEAKKQRKRLWEIVVKNGFEMDEFKEALMVAKLAGNYKAVLTYLLNSSGSN